MVQGRWLLFGILTVVLAVAWAGEVRAAGYEELQQKAAAYYSEKSYLLANQTWREAEAAGVPQDDRLTLDFYLADSLWRSRPESAEVDRARELLRAIAGAEKAGRWSAEAWESLGDSYLAIDENWEQAWEAYKPALAYWAASTDVAAARARYLGIVWKATGPPDQSHLIRRMPFDVLANALEIAKTAEDTARAHFFIGAWRVQGGDPYSLQRAGEDFRAVVEAGPGTAVYEAGLYALGEWNVRAGKSEWKNDGSLMLTPDYDAALRTFRRFVREFPEEKSELWKSAREQIESISRPSIDLVVSSQFLPGVQPVVDATWRNVDDVTFTLSRVDLAAAFHPTAKTDPDNWLSAIKVEESGRIKQWTEKWADSHAPEEREIRLDAIAEPGVYLLEAASGRASARELIFVTTAAGILETAGNNAVVFPCDAMSGDRISGEVSGVIWQAEQSDEQGWKWTRAEAKASDDGLLRFELPESRQWTPLFAFVAAAGQPAFVRDEAHRSSIEDGDWRIQVFTARAAYRPGDTVNWKCIARVRKGQSLSTPSGELVKFQVEDPNGDTVDEGEVRLTPFGTAWGELKLGVDRPLGEYSISFSHGDEEIGSDTICRLEEYRLPEFKVDVSVDAPTGGRLGDDLQAKVGARYYFGGAVADAEVEIVVTESSYMRPKHWSEEELFSDDADGGRVILDETRRTGPDGTVSLRIPTPFDAKSDMHYAVEARVVDASGREVVGNGALVVGRQSYFVDLTPANRVMAPGAPVDIAIRAENGNGRRVESKGTLTVSRQRWVEVWKDPQGNDVSGEALAKLRQSVFPPPGQSGWRVVRQEYESEEISHSEIGTNADGEARFSFVPKEEGFYRIAWSSPDGSGPPVTASTNVWASADAGGLIGYHSGGVDVIVDPEPPPGAKIPVLIVTDTPNRDVLFSVTADNVLYRAEVVHLDGDSRVMMLDPEEGYSPNVFVSAAGMHVLDFHANSREIRLQPYRQTLSVALAPSAVESLPGGDAKVELVAKDFEGRPVQGEFAVAVTDKAVSYIQQDYAGDPVEFFLEDERYEHARAVSSVRGRPFFDASRAEAAKLKKSEEKRRGLSAPMNAFGTEYQELMCVVEGPGEEAPAPADSEVAVKVRSNFNATAVWQPGVKTDEEGRAEIRFRYPDSLTTWRIVARGETEGNSFGFAEKETRTSKPLIARLQAPRFLVAGDSAVISGVINNRTDKKLDAKVELRPEGLQGAAKPQSLAVGPHGDARAEWSLSAAQPAEAHLSLTAVSSDLNDGMAVDLPVVPNGIEKAESVAGKMTAAQAEWMLRIPAERRKDSETLTITATPSLAASALDALPYLIRYPYGCVEQTMSRFLPAAATLHTLQNLGLDRAAVANRIFGGIEPQFLAQTHPRMEGDAGLGEMDAVIAKSLARLYDFQHADGSWGWWKDDESDPYMTAYVAWGLGLAQKAGVGVKSDALADCLKWLRANLAASAGDPDLQAWMLHALAFHAAAKSKPSAEEAAAIENIWQKREELTACGRALFALAVHNFGDEEKAKVLVRNLRDGVVRDDQPVPTAHWGSEGGWRRWADGGVETTAFALKALLAIDPKSDLMEPAMNWLVKNRRGAQWSNTRDTAITVLAIDDYLAATKELGATVGFEIEVNGKTAGNVDSASALTGPAKTDVDRSLLVDGDNRIVLRRVSGDAPVWFSARVDYFTTEDPIPAAGNEVFAKREYFRYAPAMTLLNGYRFDRVPWAVGEPVSANQRVETVLTIEAKNDLEYLVFEDLKPAGLEAVDVQSGGDIFAEGADGKEIPVHCELRDRKVAFFIRNLPQGTWKIHYDMRAETVGDFSALPVVGHAMYVPEIRCNGESRRVTINAER